VIFFYFEANIWNELPAVQNSLPYEYANIARIARHKAAIMD
jgi:hypothetical protein